MNSVAPVSVVVPCFRCMATIDRAVASVVAQTHRPAELILVDDASGDGTLDCLHALQQRLGDWVQVRALETNVGAAQARNVGWDSATQGLIAFLDADDAWHPRKIELQMAYMLDHPEVVLCGHLHRVLEAPVETAAQWDLPLQVQAQPVRWRDLLLRHQFVTPSVMLRRELPLRFAAKQRYMEDYRLWLEVASVPFPMAKLQVELAAIYKPPYGASGLSGDMWAMELAELAVLSHYRATGHLSWPSWLGLAAYSVLKYLRRLLVVQWRKSRAPAV